MSKQSDLVTVARDAGASGYVNVTGDTMTGPLSVDGNTSRSIFRKPNVSNNHTVATFGSDANGLHMITDNPIIASGAVFETGQWTATNSAAALVDFNLGTFSLQSASGLTVGGTVPFTQKLVIDAAGRVTMPYQPVASVSYGGQDISPTNIIPLNSNAVVKGGMSVSSNRITVPVSGTYMVGYHHLGTSTGTQIEIRKNGSSIGAGARTQINPASAYGNGSVQNPVALSANDYIEFWSISGAVHGNADYNRMYVYLLG